MDSAEQFRVVQGIGGRLEIVRSTRVAVFDDIELAREYCVLKNAGAFARIDPGANDNDTGMEPAEPATPAPTPKRATASGSSAETGKPDTPVLARNVPEEKPKSAPSQKRDLAQRGPAKKRKLVPEPDWDALIERRQAGESIKVIAADAGVPFTRLRAKWASYTRNLRSRPKDEQPIMDAGALGKPASEGTPKEPKESDEPVSGGVAGVLERGTLQPWSDEEDLILLGDAEARGLGKVALRLGRSVHDCERRLKALQSETSRKLKE